MTPDAPKAIFFDLGGTLVEPRPPLSERIHRILAAAGYNVSREAAARAVDERGSVFADENRWGWTLSHERSYAFWTSLYESILVELGIPGSRRQALARRVYGQLSQPAGYALFDDVFPTLERLADEGYVLGLISNWEAWGAQLVTHLGLDRYFPTQVISGCVGVEKPDTAIFTMALEEAKLEPGQVLYVGDSPQFDVEPAHAAGMSALLIRRDAAPAPSGVPFVRTLRDLHGHELLRGAGAQSMPES